jgi:hypothetical protein
MIYKPLNELSMRDFQALLDNGVSESRSLEYKRQLPESTYDSKKEFLADVSSFANSDGGDIIFGIAEEAGIPTEITGIHSEDFDSAILRLESLIRDGISPRILVYLAIVSDDSRTVIVIRIVKSWNKPHRVTFNHHDQFYSRNSAGKYQLDVEQLRVAFTDSNTTLTEMNNFVLQRDMAIFENDGIKTIAETAKLVLFLLPLESFSSDHSHAVTKLTPPDVPPLESYGYDGEINFDGYLTYFRGGDSLTHSYTQVYRNGIIEAVATGVFLDLDGTGAFYCNFIEGLLVEKLPKYLEIYRKLGINAPFGIGISCVGIKGYPLIYPAAHITRAINWRPFPKDILRLPIHMITESSQGIGYMLQPLFDLLWNAYGYVVSPNFDDSHKWKRPQ